MGKVLLAVSEATQISDVLGEARDFDLQSNLQRIPHTLSIEGLRSTCRHFPKRVAFAMQAHRVTSRGRRCRVRVFAAEMGRPMLERRLQDTDYALRSREHVESMKSGFEEWIRAL